MATSRCAETLQHITTEEWRTVEPALELWEHQGDGLGGTRGGGHDVKSGSASTAEVTV